MVANARLGNTKNMNSVLESGGTDQEVSRINWKFYLRGLLISCTFAMPSWLPNEFRI